MSKRLTGLCNTCSHELYDKESYDFWHLPDWQRSVECIRCGLIDVDEYGYRINKRSKWQRIKDTVRNIALGY